MKILTYVLVIIMIVFGIGYLLLAKTTYLDFIKNWPIPGIKICCVKDDTTEADNFSKQESRYVKERDLMLVSQVAVVSIKTKDGTLITDLSSPLDFKIKIDSNLLAKQGFSPVDKGKVQMYFWDTNLFKYELIGGVLNQADDNVETKINKTGTYVLGIRK